MTAREHIEGIHGSAREYKENTWYKAKVRDMPVEMMVAFDDQKQYNFPIGMAAEMLDKFVYEKGRKLNGWTSAFEAALHLGMQALLGMTDKAAPARMFGSKGARPSPGAKIRHIFLSAESYSCPPDYEAEVGVEGQLEGDERLMHDFNNNPASRIKETVMTFVIEDDLCGGVEWAIATQSYRLDDGGQIVWEDPEYIISDQTDIPREAIEEVIITNAPLRATIPYFHLEAKEQS